MSDTYGGMPIPVPAPGPGDAVSDRALTLFVEYFKAYLNAYAQTAWSSVAPPQTTMTSGGPVVVPVVRKTYTHDPAKVVFNEGDLPALFIDRTQGERPYWMAEDYRVDDDRWSLLWIYQTATQETQAIRNSFTRAIVQLIDRAVEKVRDVCYKVSGDPDPDAADVAALPTSIKLPIATSTSAHSYSGAALDGSIGGGSISPSRHIEITVAGDPLSIADGSEVSITGLGEDGTSRVATVALTQAGSPGVFRSDWALSEVTQIDVPAQDSTAATLSFGTEAWTGMGTIVMRMAGIQKIEVAKWADRFVVIKMAGQPDRSYDAVEITFNVEEKFSHDIDLEADDGATQQIAREDGSVYEEAVFQ